MRIFEDDGYFGKLNFVDDNNVFVGFDNSQSCCEDFGYIFSKTATPHKYDTTDDKTDGLEISNDDLVGWNFDTSYMEISEGDDNYGCDGSAIFRLTKDEDEIFLILYNHHNGYYGHGFDMKMGEEVLHEGNL